MWMNEYEGIAVSWVPPGEKLRNARLPTIFGWSNDFLLQERFSYRAMFVEKEYAIVPRGTPLGHEVEAAEAAGGQLGLLCWDELFNQACTAPSAGTTGPVIVVELIQEHCRELWRRILTDPALLQAIDHRRFEELIATLLTDLGFDVVELTPSGRDGGKDIVVDFEDTDLGTRQRFLVECKHWTSGRGVGLDVVLALSDVIEKESADAGVLVSSSGFAPRVLESRAFIDSKRLHIKDQLHIMEWATLWERSFASPLHYRLDPRRIVLG